MPRFHTPQKHENFIQHAHFLLVDTEGAPIRTIVVPLQNADGSFRAETNPRFSAQREAEYLAVQAGFSVIDFYDHATLIVTEGA